MTESVIVNITQRARGVLAFADELDRIEHQIAEERARHARAMEILATKRQAIEQAIFRLGAN